MNKEIKLDQSVNYRDIITTDNEDLINLDLRWFDNGNGTYNDTSEIYSIIPHFKWFKAYEFDRDLTPLNPIIDLETAISICNSASKQLKRQAIAAEAVAKGLV